MLGLYHGVDTGGGGEGFQKTSDLLFLLSFTRTKPVVRSRTFFYDLHCVSVISR